MSFGLYDNILIICYLLESLVYVKFSDRIKWYKKNMWRGFYNFVYKLLFIFYIEDIKGYCG